MAPSTPRAWLRPFLRHEVHKALDWRKDSHTDFESVDVEYDDNGQERQTFEDDGSNLRSHVTKLMHGNDLVQLVEVMSVGQSFATVRLSDGHTTVRARLSSEILARWPDDAGELLGMGTKGDVFRLKQLIVVSTSLGHAEGQIWLDVYNLEYCHHLRKLCGEPVPVHQDRYIKLLIDDMAEFRNDQLALATQVREAGTAEASDGALGKASNIESPCKIIVEAVENDSNVRNSSTAGTKQSDSGLITDCLEQPGQLACDLPRDTTSTTLSVANAPARNIPPVPVVSRLQQKNAAGSLRDDGVRSQQPKRAPNLDEDGFEELQGVNLAPPQGRSLLQLDQGRTKESTPKDSRLQILSLLNRNGIHEVSQEEHSPLLSQLSPAIISETPSESVRLSITREQSSTISKDAVIARKSAEIDTVQPNLSIHSPSLDIAASSIASTSLRREALPTTDAVNLTKIAASRTQKRRSVSVVEENTAKRVKCGTPEDSIVVSPLADKENIRKSSDEGEQDRTNAGAAFSDLQGNGSLPKALHTPMLVYGRRKIPANQQKLLEDSSSWLPPMPGEQFPQPNIPVDLLARWITESDREREKTSSNQLFKDQESTSWTESNDANKDHTSMATSGGLEVAQPEEEDRVAGKQELSLGACAREPSEGDSSEEEMFHPSQWPPTPSDVTRKENLPPESPPWEEVIRGTQASDLEVAVPRPLPVRQSSLCPQIAECAEHSSPSKHPSFELGAPIVLSDSCKALSCVQASPQDDLNRSGSKKHCSQPSAAIAASQEEASSSARPLSRNQVNNLGSQERSSQALIPDPATPALHRSQSPFEKAVSPPGMVRVPNEIQLKRRYDSFEKGNVHSVAVDGLPLKRVPPKPLERLSALARTSDEPLSAFEEYLVNMHRLKPGGAFARVSWPPSIHRVTDVLTWNLQ